MSRPRRPGSPTPTSILSLAILVLAAAAGLAAAGALTARLVAIVPAEASALLKVDDLVELVVLAGGTGVAWWLSAGLLAAAVSAGLRAAGRSWAAGERFVAHHAPTLVRRGFALALGTGVGLAVAVGPAGAQAAVPPTDVGWTATDVAAAGPPAAPPIAPTSEVDAGADIQRQVTVQPGDSLWRLAAQDLPTDASAAEIAAAWPEWYAANSDVVGADPDLLHPGQVLERPPAPAAPGAPGAGS